MRVVALLLALAACAHAAPQATQPNTAVQVVAADSLARRQLVAVAQVAPSIRQEVRYASRNNFTGEVLPGYGAAVVLLRREAAEALGRVQARLAAKGLGLKIWDGYRPVRATLAMVAWCERTGQTKLLDDGYIARRSRHNQGVAVDLTLVELASGREFDMGTPFDEFSARSHTTNATDTVAANRQLLVQAMEAEGFTNYVDEWWHFSFVVADAAPYDLPLERW
ncbi:MAG: D-alanyl-D-alanine carboxypeptidase family protein [Gemmatimonadetes bacterium]|nr:D-alanyl-D-alanine carboxypeptidase family protein [Gemmatimonadota bacterium]